MYNGYIETFKTNQGDFMTFVEKLEKYQLKISLNSYRFDKLSNFISYDEYVEVKVKKYAESLINQPLSNLIYESENKNITRTEIEILTKENCYDCISIKTRDNRTWSVPPHAFENWMKENNYKTSDLKKVQLEARGWL